MQAHPIRKRLGEIILCCKSAYYGPRQYCLKGSRSYERASKNYWPRVSERRSGAKEDSLYLANDFGRPFNNVLALPLDPPFEQEEHPPVLFIEYFSKTQTIENIFYDSKWEILQTAFSKVLTEEHLKSASDLWKHTFDGLKEPLAIVDEQSQPILSNIHFKKMYKDNRKMLSQNVLKSREQKIFEKKSYPITDEDGNTYSIEHFEDVTSHLLLREKMLKKKRMSTLGRLADDITHRLNNPLTGIRSMSQILSQETEDQKQKDNFHAIEEASGRCQNIVCNFIQFSKRSDSDIQCEVNEIIEQTLPFLKTMVATKRLTLDLDKKSMFVQADPCLLQQVLFNLIVNALQAVDAKGEVIVRSIIQDDKVEVIVEDNGCGIDLEDLSQLFDPFFTTKKEGTGLGLRISQQWIRKFGGELSCESVKGEGACFKFFLPQAQGLSCYKKIASPDALK